MADDKCVMRSGGCSAGKSGELMPEECPELPAGGVDASARGVPGAAEGAKRSQTGINAKLFVAPKSDMTVADIFSDRFAFLLPSRFCFQQGKTGGAWKSWRGGQ